MLTIIGCGNSNRTDDGAGVYVAQQLLEMLRLRPKQNVRVFDAGTGGMEVMFQARGATRLIIVDASQTGSPAGTLYEVPGAELIADRPESYSLHDFRWDNALYAGQKIFREQFPREVTVYLIEAADLGLGLELTPTVRAAADQIIARLHAIIAGYD